MNMHAPHFAAARPFERKSVEDRTNDKTELDDVMRAITARDNEIKRFAEKADAEIKETGKVAAETKAALEKVAGEGVSLQERLMAVEQKLARRAGGGDVEVKSIGQRFTESDDFRTLQTRGKGRALLNVKAINAVTSATSGTGAAGAMIRPDRQAGIVTPPQRELTIRDLLLPGRTDSNAIEYVRETGFQNSAAPVAETMLKPQSDLSFALTTVNVRTLAHWVLASRQVLSDVPQLQSYIDFRMSYGLRYVEEAQLMGGDGTGQNLLGIVPQATPYAFATYSLAADTKLDRLRRAILQVRLAEYRASAFVLHPQDWSDIQLLKDGQGRYIWSDPTINNGNNIWGLPVVDTTAIAQGKFLCGAFNIAAQIFDREDATVEVSTEDSDNFRKNMVTILAEERLALAVYRPDSFIYGNLVSGNAS